MRLALDYDKTYTLDKEFWQWIIVAAQERGHEVIICTIRHPELDWHPDFKLLQHNFGVKTYFTDGWPKKQFMENEGIVIDVWIDDSPKSIINGSAWTPNSPELAAWRAENKKNGT